jgi:hypothetical protein
MPQKEIEKRGIGLVGDRFLGERQPASFLTQPLHQLTLLPTQLTFRVNALMTRIW